MPAQHRVFKNRKFCGDTVPNEALLIGPGGELRNAVVTLTPTDRPATASPRTVVLDNRRCAFVPHVQVANLGSDLLLKNSDPILHTVHARLGKETLFNVGLPTWRQVVKRLDRAGVVRIDCDVLHTWMSAVIVVVTTPYSMVTDANGTFAMDGLPPGNYRVDVWHERLGLKQVRVDLLENRPFFLEVSFSARVNRVADLCAVC
ncbi:MAG TPA: carboxypeptidase regulatory-like domain-containing protein [Candidatus Binatia bacterium]|nr:carboxypeptidase regulatory-like domain-containing protein [Candidatus Binatia bacterium]